MIIWYVSQKHKRFNNGYARHASKRFYVDK